MSRQHSRAYANQAKPGVCVWCDEPLPLRPDGKVNKRLRWHEECAKEYRIANFSADQRRYVLEASGGICACCGQDHGDRPVLIREPNATLIRADGPHSVVRFEVGYHADHIVPLWSVDPNDPADFRFWTTANLQLLCLPCHRDKTNAEAAQRAKVRRLQAKARGRTREVQHGPKLLRRLGA